MSQEPFAGVRGTDAAAGLWCLFSVTAKLMSASLRGRRTKRQTRHFSRRWRERRSREVDDGWPPSRLSTVAGKCSHRVLVASGVFKCLTNKTKSHGRLLVQCVVHILYVRVHSNSDTSRTSTVSRTQARLGRRDNLENLRPSGWIVPQIPRHKSKISFTLLSSTRGRLFLSTSLWIWRKKAAEEVKPVSEFAVHCRPSHQRDALLCYLRAQPAVETSDWPILNVSARRLIQWTSSFSPKDPPPSQM